MLTEQIQQARALRSRLSKLQGQLAEGQEPNLADWLITLEQMTMYDKYFSQEELEQLPIYTRADDVEAEWRPLVAQVQALLDAGTDPGDVPAQMLSKQWMEKIRRDTDGNPVLFAKLNTMHEQEPSVQERTGITPRMMAFILAASKAHQLSIYRKYVDDDEFAFMQANLGKRDAEWPPLLARVRTAMDDDSTPDSPRVRALALEWFDLFRSFAGDKPSTQQKIRKALQDEPELTQSGMVDEHMRAFIAAAMQALRAG